MLAQKNSNLSWKERELVVQGNLEAVGGSTDSYSEWRLASRWLKRCDRHPLCRHLTKPSWLPTRLIKISPGQEPTTPLLKLCESVNIPRVETGVNYMTLSHCWGKISMTVLTTENLECMKHSILWSDLPKTFQHAILATQKLENEYLWIDSLCIIQNSKDWEKEAITMQDVYSNSFLNIAATSAPDGRTGCFFKRNTWKIQACELDIGWEPNQVPKKMIIRAEQV